MIVLPPIYQVIPMLRRTTQVSYFWFSYLKDDIYLTYRISSKEDESGIKISRKLIVNRDPVGFIERRLSAPKLWVIKSAIEDRE